MTTEEQIEYANQLVSKGSAIIDAINTRIEDMQRAEGLSGVAQAEIYAAHETELEEALAREVTPETAKAAIAARAKGE